MAITLRARCPAAVTASLRVTAPRRASAAARGGAARGSVRAARLIVRASTEDLDAKLAEAIKAAEDCKDDCAVDWNNVEELSAAAQHAKPTEEVKEGVVSPEAIEFIKQSA